MKTLQGRDDLTYALWGVPYGTLLAYATVFLQSQGLNSAQIGIVTGGGALATVFLSPLTSALAVRRERLGERGVMMLLLALPAAAYALLAVLRLPAALIMPVFILMIAQTCATVPLLSSLNMRYLQDGRFVNFGLARGFGSLGAALSSLAMGPLLAWTGGNAAAWIFSAFAILTVLSLASMPMPKSAPQLRTRHSCSVFTVIREQRNYFAILIGFCLLFAATAGLKTYLIDIVRRLGGGTTFLSIALFCMPVSEVPALAVVNRLRRRFGERRLLILAAVCYALKNLLLCFAWALPVILCGMLLSGLSFGLFTAVSVYYAAEILPPEQQTMGQTLSTVMTIGIGNTIGSVVGGYLQDTAGMQGMLRFYEILSLGGVVIAVLVLVCARKTQDTWKEID